jgi:hypothetical protein
MAGKTKDVKLLPLENTLRDLALLRASEVDVSVLLPLATDANYAPSDTVDIDATVESSYDLVREARKALKAQRRGGVVGQGERIEEVRNKLEQVLTGIE